MASILFAKTAVKAVFSLTAQDRLTGRIEPLHNFWKKFQKTDTRQKIINY
jgi:HAMP domain-containing protein